MIVHKVAVMLLGLARSPRHLRVALSMRRWGSCIDIRPVTRKVHYGVYDPLVLVVALLIPTDLPCLDGNLSAEAASLQFCLLASCLNASRRLSMPVLNSADTARTGNVVYCLQHTELQMLVQSAAAISAYLWYCDSDAVPELLQLLFRVLHTIHFVGNHNCREGRQVSAIHLQLPLQHG